LGQYILHDSNFPHICGIKQKEKWAFCANKRILKKPFHGLFQLGKAKMRFRLSSISNDFVVIENSHTSLCGDQTAEKRSFSTA